MKKDNNLLKFTSFVLLVVMIALILVAGTFAKYTSEATGTATATVAKWDIKAGVQGEEVSITGDDATVAFNLFDTILEENGSEEYDVIRDENGKVLKIAPGTSGAFDLSIKNDSEVTAAYTVSFLVEGAEVPFEFNVNNTGWTTSLENVGETVIEMGKSQAINVAWKWAFEGDDAVDTALGIAAEDVTVTATLNVNQYDASETSVDETPVEDFDAYALLPLASGYDYLTEWQNNARYMYATETVYLEAGTTITGHEGMETMIFVRASKEDNSVISQNDIDSENDVTIISETESTTIENTGWYDFTFANKDNSDIQADQLQKSLGYYVTFSK